ncbi:nitroreductase family protein [Vagococcus salmoninarum]|uniref:NADPH-dependent oxidoreductase n=1 Tax=Vagococcus salmoninarum TaxID=2739 RepID=A0A429ZU40_9ENTE|nr:nitroreductase family protein [Vagococcus salmoninarum]RST97256.1 NADPH-dependent oxidoreductase [Vagococcus salmoninarum]
MTEIIDLMLEHRSYRDFEAGHELSPEELASILAAAQQAPSWMNGQFYSMIVLKDREIREQLVALNPGNPHILNSSVFILFIADFNRTYHVSQKYHVPYQITNNHDALITATTDGALAFENALVAAESLGYGCCPIGSIRKQSLAIIDLLNLPAYTLPLFGLAIGKPTVAMKVKPRLPKGAVIHYDGYQSYDYALIESYDQVMAKFGEKRETKAWSQKFADYFANAKLSDYDEVLRQQKFID